MQPAVHAATTSRVLRQMEVLAAMMARAGVDELSAAREDRGRAFARAHKACIACTVTEECRAWLARAGRPNSGVPDFCPNAAYLRRHLPD